MSDINFIYCLFFLLLLLSILSFFLFDFDVMEPANIFLSTMTASALFGALNVQRWSLSVSFFTLFIVLGGVLSFLIGSFFSYFELRKIASDYRNDNYTGADVRVYNANIKIFILCIVSVILLGFSFKEVYDLALQLGNTGGISTMISTVRYPMERQEVSFSRWMSYRSLFVQSVCYVYIYIFFDNLLNENKIYIKYLLPIFIYIPFTILTTGRMDILFLLVYTVTVFSILYFKKKHYSIASKKIICIVLFISAISFLGIFLLYGFFTGKVVTEERTPFVIISHYVGLSFPALDKFLNGYSVESLYIGNNTFSGIYNNLISLGIDLPRPNIFLDFIEFEGINTNVYSAFRRYIEDYGIIGMMAVLFIFGSMFSFVYNYILKKKNNKYLIIMYATYAWTLVLSFHDEKFIMGIINTNFVYHLLLYWGLFSFLKLTI